MVTARTFARIDLGRVVEIIGPMFYEVDAPAPPDPDNVPPEWPTFKAGEEVPIEMRFTSAIVATLVDVTEIDVEVGYAYANGVFEPYAPPLPSPSEILASNTATRDALLRIATQRIAPLQDAVDLGVATAEETTADRRQPGGSLVGGTAVAGRPVVGLGVIARARRHRP